MFSIPLHVGFEVYLGLMLAGLALAVALSYFRGGPTQWKVIEEQLCFCRECHFTFLVRRKANIVRCPRCRSLCRVRPRL